MNKCYKPMQIVVMCLIYTDENTYLEGEFDNICMENQVLCYLKRDLFINPHKEFYL